MTVLTLTLAFAAPAVIAGPGALATVVSPGLLIGLAAVFGLAIGSFLNVVVYRVPAGKSLVPASRCPHCEAPIRPWQNVPIASWIALRGKCAGCRAPISARYPLVEFATMVAFAAVAWWGLYSPALPPAMLAGYLFLAAASIALALIDFDTQRLPNAIVYPTALVLALCVLVSAATTRDWGAALTALIASAGLALFYLVLWSIGGMGLGDVKLALALGLALGWVGWPAVIVGTFAAFAAGGVYGLALVARRRAGRKTRVPFGPWMLLGAWIGLTLGDPLVTWYLNTFFAR
ncbi:prepilin peptidase [Leucobacter sp. HY1910]